MDANSKVSTEPHPARTRSGLAYSVSTPSGLRGRLEVGPDVSPGAQMVEVGAGIEVPPTSANQIPPIPLCRMGVPLDPEQQQTTPPSAILVDKSTLQNFTLNEKPHLQNLTTVPRDRLLHSVRCNHSHCIITEVWRIFHR